MLTCGMPWQHRDSASDGDQPIRTTIDGYMIGFAKRSFQTVD